MGKEDVKRKRFSSLISNYVIAMKEHLRAGVKDDLLTLDEETTTSLKQKKHKPNFLASELYNGINEMYKSEEISGEQLFLLDKELKGITDNIGACERIRNTSIPYSYSMYIKKFIFIYSITLPFGFVNEYDWWTILVTAFIFYFLLTIELIAEEIEDPFGVDDNDLPTDELSVSIGNDVEEILLN